MKRVNRERSRAWLLRWSGSRSAVLASASLGRTSKILYILLGGGREGYGGEERGPSPNAPLGRAREPCAAAVACGQLFFLSVKSSERGCLSVLLPSLVAAIPASTAAGPRRRRLSAGRKEAGPNLLLASLFFAALWSLGHARLAAFWPPPNRWRFVIGRSGHLASLLGDGGERPTLHCNFSRAISGGMKRERRNSS